MRIKIFLWSAFVVCVGSFCRVSAQPSVADYLAQTAERYHFSQWGGRTRASYTAPLTSWHLPALSVPTNGMNVCVSSRQIGILDKLQIYILPQRSNLLWVQVLKCPDVLSAHEAILDGFNAMQSTYDYSSTTNNFGDQSYVTNDFAVFARNNVFVKVHSYTNSISAEVVARQIDADILQKSTANE